jgi:hypothetical protein
MARVSWKISVQFVKAKIQEIYVVKINVSTVRFSTAEGKQDLLEKLGVIELRTHQPISYLKWGLAPLTIVVHTSPSLATPKIVEKDLSCRMLGRGPSR